MSSVLDGGFDFTEADLRDPVAFAAKAEASQGLNMKKQTSKRKGGGRGC